MRRTTVSVPALFSGLRNRDVGALSRAITLVESTRTEDLRLANQLLDRCMPRADEAFRLGITGAPGVGKSTLIEAFGLHLLAHGARVAVLSVDPTSPKSRGSILGDKTRMEELSRAPGAYVRPSPAGRTLGGLAQRTREAVVVCAAAGFDWVIVETVGVGQSETLVAGAVDFFLLLQQPGGGDELQGIKRGVMELADGVFVTKQDAHPQAVAAAVKAYQAALHYLQPPAAGWAPFVLGGSAYSGAGLDDLLARLSDFRAHAEQGLLAERRAAQRSAWLQDRLQEGILLRLQHSHQDGETLAALRKAVSSGELSPPSAAAQLLAAAGVNNAKLE